MFRYADPAACPRCRTTLAPLARACPSCQAALDDRRAYDVFQALQQVDSLVARLADAPAPRTQPARVPVAAPVASTPVAGVPAGGPVAAPAAGDPVRAVMSGLTVPKVLLGLGALCLVVAALVFLAVAWASLGVGGRTTVLLGFTVTAAGLAAWSARAGLRAGAEALTAVAFGLLVLDLAGARTAGWFGEIDIDGFALLAGSVVTTVGAVATLATRRTPERRILSTEIATSLGVLALLPGLGSLDLPSLAAWLLTCLGVTGAVAVAGWRLRLGIATWTAAVLAAASWAGIAGIGVVRLVMRPSWAEQLEQMHGWPLLVAAVLAAAPGLVRALPVAVRVGGVAVAVVLLTGLVATPALDEGSALAALMLTAVVGFHAVAAWRLPPRWVVVTSAPLALAGCAAGLMALAAALAAATRSGLLDQGLWAGGATSPVAVREFAAVWALLLPVTAAAAATSLVVLAGTARVIDPRRLVTLAGSVVVALSSLSPVLYGVPRHEAVGALVLATAVLVGWALRRGELAPGVAALPVAMVALGAALADDGLTIAVFALLTMAMAAAGSQRVPSPVREGAAWALPVAAAATTWAVASALDVSAGWRAAPVIAVVGLLAAVRPRVSSEVAGLAAALVVVVVGASLVTPDLRIVAGQLTALALLATAVGIVRRTEASVTGLGLFALAAMAAWPYTVTATVVVAVATGIAVLHELRRVDPVAMVARVATPVALGALVWSVGDLAGLATGRAVPVMVVLGALMAWRAEPLREVPAAGVGILAAMVALVDVPDGSAQTWLAAYLTLAGVAATGSSLLHRDRRDLAWVGLGTFTAAQWLRLEQLGVGTVEAYTLPLAAVLLTVGTVALLRGDRSSMRTQGAGLGLALVPTLLQVLVEPVGLRAVLLGVACVVLVGVGIRLRWAAPFVAGAVTLAILALRQMTHAQVLPQWALLGLAGVTLTFVGLTWERRLTDLRTAAGYVRALR